MLVLCLAVLLLVVSPMMLLFLGRAIQRVTDGRHDRPAVAEPGQALTAEDAWYRRGMRPAFYRDEEDAQPAP